MVLAVIKRTGSKCYKDKIESNDEAKKLYLGNIYEPITIDHTFSERNIEVLANPGSYETGIEPNIFVVSQDNPIPCQRILFGNVLFYKKVNNEYIDLTDDDVEFVENYINTYDMSENEKAMAGLFQYSPEQIGQRFNKEKK